MSDTTALYELQQIDVTWDKVKRRLLQIQKLLGEPKELTNARAQVEKTSAELHEWQGKQKNAELESQSLAVRIKETDETLMGGKVHSPKELEALQASLESLKRQRATVDDLGVEAMLSAEDLTAQLARQQAEMDEIESNWIAGQDKLKVEGAKMKRNFLVLKKKRESSAAAMDAALLTEYEDLRRRKGGVAVTLIQSDTCGACHMQIPTGVVSSVRSEKGVLVTCPSCGRILVDN